VIYPTPTAPRREKQSTAFFVLFLAMGVSVAAYVGYPQGRPSPDAVIRAGIGEDLFQGVPRGRQGLIGSLRWAPLPTLLSALFLRLPSLRPGPFAQCIVAAGAYALLCAFLNSWWAGKGLGVGVRFPALAALYLSPWARHQIASGSSTPVFVMLAVLSGCLFIDWWETDELRSLAYLSIVVGLAILTRYQFILIFLGILVAVFLHVLLHHPRGQLRAYAEGTLILYTMPALYVVGVWFIANWLIMGDPTFFMRGLPWGHARPAAWRPLLEDGCRWAACGVPFAVALVGWLGRKVFRRGRLLAGLPAAGLALFVLGVSHVPVRPSMAETRAIARALEELDTLDRVAVSGHVGYVLLDQATPRVRQMLRDVHSLSFYEEKALESSRGRNLYVLVPPDRPEYRWEDIRLKYPGMAEAQPRFVVFERELPAGWRLLGYARTDLP